MSPLVSRWRCRKPPDYRERRDRRHLHLRRSLLRSRDGHRVKSVLRGVMTYYVGNYYKYVNSNTTKKYYYAGGQRVAMRRGSSTLYYPWCDTRFTSGTPR